MKKVVSLVLILVVILTVSAYALPIEPDVPSICPDCRGTVSLSGTSEGEWSGPSGQRLCSECGGYDLRYTRKVTSYYACELCSYHNTTTKLEVKWFCKNELLQR